MKYNENIGIGISQLWLENRHLNQRNLGELWRKA